MTTVSLPFAPFLQPILDPALLATVRRRVAVGASIAARALGLLGGSAAMAAGLWLMLAGPGFLHDGASTAPARVMVRR